MFSRHTQSKTALEHSHTDRNMMPSFLFPEHSFRIVERQRRGTVAGTCMGREWGWHTKMNRTKRRREGGGGVASRRGTEKGALGQSAWPCHVGRRRPVLSSSAGGGRGARVECRCGLPMLDGGRGAGVERCGLPMTEGGGWSSPRQPVAARARVERCGISVWHYGCVERRWRWELGASEGCFD